MLCLTQANCGETLLNLLIIGLSNGAVIALMAIGVTLVYGVVRTINFAYGDVFALTTIVVTTLIASLGLYPGQDMAGLAAGLLLTLGVAMGVAVLLNVGIERLAFRPFRGRSQLAPLIATLGLSFILYQFALIWRKLLPTWIAGEHRSVPGLPEVPRGSIPELIPDTNLILLLGSSLDIQFRLEDLVIILLATACALLVALFLQRTALGRALRAVSQDATLAQICGVNLDHAIAKAFAIGGALAGVAAFAFAIYTTHPYGLHGAQSGLTAFTAAILGGIGSPVGALLAGLLLGVFGAFSDYFLAAQWTPVLVNALLIGLLVFRPTGLASDERGVDLSTAPVRDAVSSTSRLDQRRARWLTGGLLLLGLVYPVLDSAFGWQKQSVVTSIVILALLALGLNWLLGFAGLLDLGYAASFGIGAYTAALLINPWGKLAGLTPQPLDILVVISLCMGIAGFFGAINGWLTLRIRSDYLAIVTLAFGHMVRQTVINLNTWTGGSQGVSALPAPQLFAWTLNTPVQRYYLIFALVALVTGISFRLLRSRLGRAWQAIGDDEVAAASSGIDVLGAKTLAFTLGTAVAGMAGALYVSAFSHISPEQLDFTVSAMVLAMVIIGGAGSVPGVIVGALVIASYDRLLLPALGAFLAEYRTRQGGLWNLLDLRELNFMAFGLALYLTVLLRTRRRT